MPNELTKTFPIKTPEDTQLEKDQRELFVRYYLAHNSDYETAAKYIGIEDGYAYFRKKSVQREYRRQLAQVMCRLGVNAERVMKGITSIAFSDVAAFFDERGNLKPLHQIPEEFRAAIVGVGEGKFGREYKLGSKERALELLAKYLGMFVEKHEVKHTGTIRHVKVERSELDERMKLIESGSKKLDDFLG